MSQDESRLAAVVPYGRAGASSRVRVFDWLDALGLDADVFDFAGLPNNSGRSLARHPMATLRAVLVTTGRLSSGRRLLLSREASPLSTGGVERSLMRHAAHGVYDFDDALFHDVGSGVRRRFSKAVKCREAAVAADRVIAGNEYLADWASGLNDSVTVIPSCVDPTRYTVKTTWDLGEVPRLLWMGSGSTEQFLQSIAGPLLRVNEILGARLTVVSALSDRSLGELDRMVDRVAWTADGFAHMLALGDVGIAPLDDTDYARGKCAYKLIQYAASGLPVVGSPVGANTLALRRFDGLAPETDDEWVDALLLSLSEPASQREARARAGLAAVGEWYSFDRWKATWRDVVLG